MTYYKCTQSAATTESRVGCSVPQVIPFAVSLPSPRKSLLWEGGGFCLIYSSPPHQLPELWNNVGA